MWSPFLLCTYILPFGYVHNLLNKTKVNYSNYKIQMKSRTSILIKLSIDLQWYPLATSNLIHKRLLVIIGNHCSQTFLILMAIRNVFSLREKIACYSWVFVVTELVISGIQCSCSFVIGTTKRYFESANVMFS